MYLIKTFDGIDDEQGTIIHTPYANGEKISDGSIDLVGDGISSFEFSINPSNPAWNNIRPLDTLITVTDANSGKLLFDGRVLKPVQTMSAGGQFNIKYTAESKLAYLQDSTQRHGEYNNMTVREFLVAIIDQHNRQIEPHKHFEVGEVTVTTSTDNVYRFLGYEKTFEAIQDKLIDRLGGHLRLREGKYIDYLQEVGELRSTPIRLRSNLKDMQKEIDPTEIITRLVPLGARIESENENETNAVSEPRITIESVNNGIDYLDDVELIKEFGIIEDNITFDDVNVPSTLKLRGEQFFQSQKAARVSYDVTAPNLNLIDSSFEEFEVDDWYPIDNPIFAINEPIQIIGQTIDILNPSLSKLQIGEKHRTLSEYQAQANKQMLTMRNLEERVDRLGSQNSRINQELKEARQQLISIQDDLTNADLESLPEELQSIGEQILGLQQTLENLEIPEYNLVTTFEAGLMSPQDKSKLDLIHTTKLVNLDDMLARIEALEQPKEGGGA